MEFGFHISIAGGLDRVFARALEKGCTTLQLFSRNPRGWRFKDLDDEVVSAWLLAKEEGGIEPVVIHMPYLPNLAAAQGDQYERSLNSLIAELKRAELLDVSYICTHIGKALGKTGDAALACVVRMIDRAIVDSGSEKAMLLLENTAGQGSEVGNTIAEIARIVELSKNPERLGICLDTCHAHAAGYDLASSDGLEKLLLEIESMLGLERLRVVHLNDSKGECGSNLDRHQHIGKGTIGEAGMQRILTHPILRDLPFIMETPENDDGDDESNLETVRRLSS